MSMNFDVFVSRFWARVDKTPGCWNWTGQMNRHGYGKVTFRGRSTLAHRLSFEFANGRNPGGMWVLHKCDNRRCVRPEHLYEGTPAQNVRDCIERNRKFRLRGELNGNAILTEEDARAVIALSAAGAKRAALASRFGVSPATISHVVTGYSWSYLDRSALRGSP